MLASCWMMLQLRASIKEHVRMCLQLRIQQNSLTQSQLEMLPSYQQLNMLQVRANVKEHVRMCLHFTTHRLAKLRGVERKAPVFVTMEVWCNMPLLAVSTDRLSQLNSRLIS